MPKRFRSIVLFSGLLFLFLPRLSGQSKEATIEKASEAIRRGDYSNAVRLCLDELKFDPIDYELNFLLGRAYAYSGRYEEALEIFHKMSRAYPGNTDVLLFRSRVESWKKNYPAAVSGYQEVLTLSPGNREALIGLAEVASWQGDYPTAVSLYSQLKEQHPEDPDLHFRLARVYLWDGNYARARKLFGQALRLSPDNKDYERALKTASPRWQDRFEIRFEGQNESWSDGRSAYLDERLAFQIPLTRAGPLVLKIGRAERFGEKETYFDLEFYPRLWKRAYAYLDAAVSPRSAHLPHSQYLVEIYQGISSAWDFSLGYRRMNFSSRPANIYFGSIGRYLGRFLVFLRWYYTPDQKGAAFSWTANLRTYFSDSNFLWFAFGRGSRPYEIAAVDDLDIARSSIYLAGIDWVIMGHLRLQLNYTRRQGDGLRRDVVNLGTGFRW